MDIVINIAVFLITAVIFTFVGVYIRKKAAESKLNSAENEAKQIIERAKIEAENGKKAKIHYYLKTVKKKKFSKLKKKF